MDYPLYPYGNNAYVPFYLTMPYIITIVSLTAEVKKLKENCLQLGNNDKSNDKKKSDN